MFKKYQKEFNKNILIYLLYELITTGKLKPEQAKQKFNIDQVTLHKYIKEIKQSLYEVGKNNIYFGFNYKIKEYYFKIITKKEICK